MSESTKHRSDMGVPPNWAMYRMRHICEINPSKTETSGLDPLLEVSFVPMEKLGENGTLALDLAKPLSEVRQGFTYFRDNDVIFAKITPSFENGKVTICANLKNGIGFGTTELHVLRTRIPLCESRYIFYVVSSSDFRQLGVASMQGVAGQQRVTEEFVSEFPVLLPPLLEQRAIADFLDRETAKIDALIARKQRLLELLAERRQALITHAVTKGLDPDAPMKDSGIEWLGEIPEHWDALPLKRLAEINYGLVLELDRSLTNGIPIISLPNVTKQGELILDETPFTELDEAGKNHFLLKKGDLLFNWRNGSTDHVGKTAYFDAEGEYVHVSFLLRLRFDLAIHDSRYFHRYLNGLRSSGFFTVVKSQVNNTFNATELGGLYVQIPPKTEQTEIANYLDNQTAKIDRLSDRIQSIICRIKERRAALINEAVTGKLKVTE